MKADRKLVADRFGGNLHACRRRAELSREELSLRASIHRSDIGKFEQGNREPRLDIVVKLASATSTSINDLFRGIGWKDGEFHLKDSER